MLVLLALCVFGTVAQDCAPDVGVSVILTRCGSSVFASTVELVARRINLLGLIDPHRVTLSTVEVFSERDAYDVIYNVYKSQDNFTLGVLSDEDFPAKVRIFGEVLGVPLGHSKLRQFAIEAAVQLLQSFNRSENVTVVAASEDFLREFSENAEEEGISPSEVFLGNFHEERFEDVVVVGFEENDNVKDLLGRLRANRSKRRRVIFIPLQVSSKIEYPEGSYVILPFHLRNFFDNAYAYISTPLIVDVVENLNNFLFNSEDNRNPRCLKNHSLIDLSDVLNRTDVFLYKICLTENSSLTEVMSYNILDKTLMTSKLDLVLEEATSKPCQRCLTNCKSSSRFRLRPESWVFIFLAIALLGVLLCLTVLVFLLIRILKGDVLRGNQVLTILLLFSVMAMYASITFFIVEDSMSSLCLLRALSATLIYAFAFSLLLSRSILLAAVAKDMAFVSHVPGSIQTFLSLFIFAVQCALSINFLNNCEDVLGGTSFVYMMSYNVILVVLLVFISPLNVQSDRNYKEGKHFTIAVVIVAVAWSCWIPAYAVLDNQWKDLLVCLGLVSTATAFLGAVFVPRTYLMMVTAVKDKVTNNALSSLHTSSSIMNVYRAASQPIYDDINVAAINAVTIARHSELPYEPPTSLRSCYEDDFDFPQQPVTPPHDKVTRF